ncbi:hypothetical protein CERSUDRAFT_121172 [Gelatoporia subvermispora B]|uniref:Uncharacterized protein n=1 Tax=Ceriporiopsis subvermispora (strain B) TaxID=914234 RepID=M2PUI5_CERS8|nr:hypothetical protein CERSUDRAFT_121172 [Gelatoporia subvermispora B]
MPSRQQAGLNDRAQAQKYDKADPRNLPRVVIPSTHVSAYPGGQIKGQYPHAQAHGASAASLYYSNLTAPIVRTPYAHPHYEHRDAYNPSKGTSDAKRSHSDRAASAGQADVASKKRGAPESGKNPRFAPDAPYHPNWNALPLHIREDPARYLAHVSPGKRSRGEAPSTSPIATYNPSSLGGFVPENPASPSIVHQTGRGRIEVCKRGCAQEFNGADWYEHYHTVHMGETSLGSDDESDRSI